MKNLILASAVLIGLFSCGGEEDLAPVNQELEVVLSLWQTLPVEPNNLQLLITNASAADCTNTELLFEFTGGGSTADLEIMGFSRPSDCVDGDGFVTTAIDLVSDQVEKNINITNRGELSEGKMRISDTALEMRFLETNSIMLEEETLNRIPENLVWGYITATADETTDINQLLRAEFPDAFIDSALTDLAPGYYGHFTIGMDPSIDRYVLTEVDGDTELDQTVLFRLGADRWSELAVILDETANKFPGFRYHIYNSGGFVLRG